MNSTESKSVGGVSQKGSCGSAGGAVNDMRYRGFLLSILVYYATEAAWSMLSGLGWVGPLYVETIFFFLALVAFVFMWCRFAVSYLRLGKWTARILGWYGYALLAFSLVALAVNPFTGCLYAFDAQGGYQTGLMRDWTFFLLVAFNVLIAASALVKALGGRDAVRPRSVVVFIFSLTMAAAMALQVVWPLTPFSVFGCLIGNCFFHAFVVRERLAENHAAELERALARARMAEKSRSMFFSIVSHDIRTPLNAILGYSELLQNGIESPAERNEAFKSIRACGTALLQLVNDVLDLAKIDAGKMTLQPESVLLSRLTDDVFASFRMAAAAKGIELVNRTAGVPAVLLDAHRFRQILFNLIGNAVKFTVRGIVTVAASYTDTTLEVSVSDTGCGIPPDMLTHILDPFVQVQDPSHYSAEQTRGTGLGLSICRSLVNVMGGKLTVESELEKGSTFRICIPRVTISPETPAAEPKQVAAVKKLPKHVLVVDDSSVNRLVLAALLKRAGIASIDHAVDGVDALAKLDSALKTGHPYDFVFSDFWMPNMNGLEFIAKLRGDARFIHLPVFAVTADTEARQDARANLFTGILIKPMTSDKLIEVFCL